MGESAGSGWELMVVLAVLLVLFARGRRMRGQGKHSGPVASKRRRGYRKEGVIVGVLMRGVVRGAKRDYREQRLLYKYVASGLALRREANEQRRKRRKRPRW